MEYSEKERQSSFLEGFVAKYGPKNSPTAIYPIKMQGSYRGILFSTKETRCSYFVTIGEDTRKFSNAWEAGRWIEKAYRDSVRFYD